MDSTIRPLYLCLSIIWSYVVCEATYTASQEVDCDPSSNLPCSTDVKYQDLTYGVTEDIEIALKFRFTGQTCQNPKISMQFVQQDFESSNEYLKVYDGAATTDPELAQCGTVEGYAIGDCGYHNCLDAKALGNTNMVDEVNLMIFVEKNVDGLGHSSAGGELCPGGYNLDAKLALTCEAVWCETCSRLGVVESDVELNTGRLDTVQPKVVALETAVQTLEETMREMRASLAAYSGATAAPLGMNDYVLLVLGMVNVVLLTILLVHCSYTRASKTVPYGKVLAYDTESA